MKRFNILLAGALILLGATLSKGQSVGLIKLSDIEATLERSGPIYVVNFWATWCAPCVRELPYFQQIHSKYGGSDVKVMLVSLDNKNSLDSKVRPFVGRSGITADFFLLDETNQQVYIDRIESSWSGALPATLIVNPGKGKRKFIEGELTLAELEDALQSARE